jgi:hypothetical protein
MSWADIFANPWAYLPPRSSLWLWVGGPLIILITYFLTMRSSEERRKRLREADIWRASIGPERLHASADNKGGAPFRPDPSKKKPQVKVKNAGPPRVPSLPAVLHRAVLLVGGGELVASYELVKDVAYLTLAEANGTAGSNYQAVSAKLEEIGPTMLVRPLQRVDGVPVPNTGVQFKKDPELMNLFQIDGVEAKAIGRWLSQPIRRALCELPGVWIRVEGKTMTVTVFGTVEADQLDALVQLADTIFAEHGAEGGPSLFGEEAGPAEAAPPPANFEKPSDKPKKTPKKPAPPSTSETLSETPISKRRG